jgi:prolyl-tRNA synthetase
MKMSRLLIPTMKNDPAQVSDPGIALMMRKGYASFSNEGNRLSLLPLGLKVKNNLAIGIEEKLHEMNFQPLSSSLSFDEGRSIVQGNVQSYRHLPFNLMEPGDADLSLAGYSRDFYTAEDDLKSLWKRFETICTDLGLEVFSWKDVSVHGHRYCIGTLSGKGYFRSGKGLACSDGNCTWRGTENSFVPFSDYDDPVPGEMEEVHTPGTKTIAELCSFLNVEPCRTVKTMLFMPAEEDPSLIAVLIRGDRNVNETKLAAHLGVRSVRPATSEEIGNVLGDTEGFLGPVGLPGGIRIVADKSVEGAAGVVVGANRKDYHITGACWGRDFQVHSMADLSRLEAGNRCPKCGAKLEEVNITKLCELYLKAGPQCRIEDITYLDASNEPAPVAFWKGTVDITSFIVALFRMKGSLPRSLAPFHTLITIPSMKNGEAVELAAKMEQDLEGKGFSVLVDDREMRGGVKFADAEILDLPFTIVVGRGASDGKVELWPGDGKREEIDVDLALSKISQV